LAKDLTQVALDRLKPEPSRIEKPDGAVRGLFYYLAADRRCELGLPLSVRREAEEADARRGTGARPEGRPRAGEESGGEGRVRRGSGG
jgi:hypothetical protein